MSDKKLSPRAVALEYGSHAAPRVIARAEGDLALLMARAADELGIPAIKDEHLSEVLARLQVNEQIPEDMYVAVAVVMAWAYWLADKTPPPRQPE
jgi:flagellar biosynthesis protein